MGVFAAIAANLNVNGEILRRLGKNVGGCAAQKAFVVIVGNDSGVVEVVSPKMGPRGQVPAPVKGKVAVRHCDDDYSPGPADAKQITDRPHGIGEMLENVIGDNEVEGIIGELAKAALVEVTNKADFYQKLFGELGKKCRRLGLINCIEIPDGRGRRKRCRFI